jgi:hypothetical protein
MADKSDEFFRELVNHHVSGQLKVAPEHSCDAVLKYMGKPRFDVYRRFYKKFFELDAKYKKNQFLVPYFISSHPGCTLRSAVELAEYLNSIGHMPEQVQDFYPTPGTIATCMYYTELDPFTMEKVYVPKERNEKAMQRALLQYRNPKNYDLVYEALVKANRQDLIGHGPKCLIRPTKPKAKPEGASGSRNKKQTGLKPGGYKPAKKQDSPKGGTRKANGKPAGKPSGKTADHRKPGRKKP